MPVLLVCAEPALTAAVERCAAAAGAALESADAITLRRRWERAELVLVGVDALADLPPLPRRPGVIVVGAGIGTEPDAATWRHALAAGAEHVVSLPEAEGWLVDRLGVADDERHATGVVVAVIGTCGGAGASTLSLALGAVAASRGRSALVVDADACGGGLEVLAGTDGQPGARWPAVQAGDGRIAPASLRGAFPTANGAAVLSVQRTGADRVTMERVRAVSEAARRAVDLVVVDLPRALSAEVDADHRVLLALDRVRPVLAAAQLAGLHPGALVALRQARGGIDAADAAAAIGMPVAVSFGSERIVAEAGEHGDPLPSRGALVTAASTLLDRVLP